MPRQPDETSSGLGSLLESAVGVLAEAALEILENTQFKVIKHPRGHGVVVGACKKDAHDPNDQHYEKHREVSPRDLPTFVDLRSHLTPVEDQGALGSCTANAIAGAYEYLEKRVTGQEKRLSRLFVYFNERKIEGTVTEDSGAQLRTGMKVLQKFGVCRESTWPYHIKSYKNPPPEMAYHEASAHLIDEYRRVPVDLHAMKTCLAEGYPFVLGARIFSAFEEHGHHGRIQLPKRGEEDLGGHAMLACGYSDQDRVFVVRNSWGPDWGDRGYCYFPYDYLTDPKYVDDCWTLRKAHNLDFTDGSGSNEARRSFFMLDDDTIDESVDGTDLEEDGAEDTVNDDREDVGGDDEDGDEDDDEDDDDSDDGDEGEGDSG